MESFYGFGPAVGSMQVAVCTRQARMLLRGRGRDIPGLQKFARRARDAGRQSARDDPFADYALVQAETEYGEAVKRLRETRIRHAGQWREACSSPTVSRMPPVRFREVGLHIQFSVHAGMALNLILQLDAIVCMLQTMSQLKILKHRDAFGEIDMLASGIRRMMSAAVAWAPTGCTRRDLVERSDRAFAAVERLAERGFIDRSMFSGLNDMCDCFGGYAYRPKFAPAIDAEALFGD